MEYREAYEYWKTDYYFDDSTHAELEKISDNEEEIKDRFYRDLEFGTGGLRGVIGAGTNRMNIYTVRRATQGLANYIKAQGTEEKGVAIAYDSRFMSKEFADETALCLNANNIKTYVFSSLRPTPELSFAVRFLGCTAGIVITASHNPPEYNGYKVYWEDGAQITAPRDKDIIAMVNAVNDYADVITTSKEQAIANHLYSVIDEEIDDAYMAELKKLIIHKEAIKEAAKELKIVYSPFNGTGNIPVRRILSELGFENVYVVKEQELPDPKFTTLKYPNPEDPEAFTLALRLAKEVDADIVLATDPDADRLGIYAKDTKSGEYIPFTGNMSGMIIAEYILRELTVTGNMPENPALVKTIVTTNLADLLAKDYNCTLIEVLTGFKYIGEQIKWFKENNTYNYVFGLEESYGCLAGTHARDKDAVVAVMCLCEAAAFYKCKGLTLWDQMINIYEKYGYFCEGMHTITLKGMEGAAKIKEIMESIRKNPPKQFDDLKVIKFRDYSNNTVTDILTGETGETGLPKSNVLYFELENDSWCCMRPSGTEPKIKFYMGVKGTSLEDSRNRMSNLKAAVIKAAEA